MGESVNGGVFIAAMITAGQIPPIGASKSCWVGETDGETGSKAKDHDEAVGEICGGNGDF